MDFNAGDLEVARELGLPAGFLGRAFNGLAAGTFGVLFFIVGGVIFWRRSDDWMGLFVSFTLVFLGALLFTSSDDALLRTYPELNLTAEVLGALAARPRII